MKTLYFERNDIKELQKEEGVLLMVKPKDTVKPPDVMIGR